MQGRRVDACFATARFDTVFCSGADTERMSVNGVTRHSQAGEFASWRFWCRFHDNLCAE